MPLKKRNHSRNKIIIWIAAAVLLFLLIWSFAPTRHITEVVLL